MKRRSARLAFRLSSVIFLGTYACSDDDGREGGVAIDPTGTSVTDMDSSSTTDADEISSLSSSSATSDDASTRSSTSSTHSTATTTGDSTSAQTTSDMTTSGDTTFTTESPSETTASTSATTASTSATTSASSSTTTTTTTTTTTSTDEGCAADPATCGELAIPLIDALCTWSEKCCTATEFDTVIGAGIDDAAGCITKIYNRLFDDNVQHKLLGLEEFDELLADLADEIELWRSRPIEGGIAACVAAIQARACNEEKGECVAPAHDDPCALTRLFEGQVPVGGTCNGNLRGPLRDIECVAGSSCEDTQSSPSASDFRCVRKGLVGQFCEPEAEFSESACEYGLYCDPVSGRCSARSKLGEACSYADADAPHAPDVAAMYKKNSDPHAADRTGYGNLRVPCEAGLVCDPLRKQCVSLCAQGAKCQLPTDPWGNPAGNPRFADRSALREDGDESGCAAGMSCLPIRFETNVSAYYFHCGAPRAAGGLCNTHGDCASGTYCTGVEGDSTTRADLRPGQGTCRPLLARGQVCTSDGQCQSDHFCGSCALAQAQAATGLGPVFNAANYPGCSAVPDSSYVCQKKLPQAANDATKVPCAVDDADPATDASDRAKASACTSAGGCSLTERLSDGTSVALGYYCLAGAQPQGAPCTPGLGPDYFRTELNYARFSYSTDAVWSSQCAAGLICTDAIANQKNEPGDYRCQPGVALGGRCDYESDTEAIGFCAEGRHCVGGQCLAFLRPNQECDFDQNPYAADGQPVALRDWWNTSMDMIRKAGFHEQICHPDNSACVPHAGRFVCAPARTSPKRTPYCAGTGR